MLMTKTADFNGLLGCLTIERGQNLSSELKSKGHKLLNCMCGQKSNRVRHYIINENY